MIKEINLADQAATERAARTLGSLLRAGDFVALYGDLGAGKTTFARALIQGLYPHETEVPSPTFTLVQTYGDIAHLDLYRLSDSSEIDALGWDELREGIMLVEWPERLGNRLPSPHISVSLSYGVGEGQRILRLEMNNERLAAWRDE